MKDVEHHLQRFDYNLLYGGQPLHINTLFFKLSRVTILFNFMKFYFYLDGSSSVF